jgi:molybdopterin-guanine dinucleotide biosynthesis protein B
LQSPGYHKIGKTKFLKSLHKQLKESGMHTAIIKHHGHKDGDENLLLKEGTDSSKLWDSAPDALMYVTPDQAVHQSAVSFELKDWVLFYQMMNRFDVLLIEGYKKAGYMKVLFHRSEEDDHLLTSLENIQYIVTADSPVRLKQLTAIPVYSRSESQKIIDELIEDIGGNLSG